MTRDASKKDLVLVVDDSPESLGMIKDTLDDAGLTVLVAMEGKQAINIASHITPDIILMDAIMPIMNGFDTCKQIKENHSLCHVPVIFMTGLSDTDSIVKGFAAGGVDYIQKPIKSDELIVRMRVHLENARLTQSAQAALDSTGQYLFTTSPEGDFKWATPQAHHLFSSSGVDHDWLLVELKKAIEPLLSNLCADEACVKITTLRKPLGIKLVSAIEGQERVLRLIDLELPDWETILTKAFDLTAREAEVLKWISMGKSNSEIAIILNISPRTINTHLVQIFRKLGVENRTSAAIVAHKELEKTHKV